MPDPPATAATDAWQRRRAAFDEVVRGLVGAGYELYWHVRKNFPKRGPLADAWREVARAAEEPVQIALFDPDAAFPWAMLYDAPLAEQIVGAPPPVCDRFRRIGAAGDPVTFAECLAGCPHGDRSNVVCVWGFWGMRFSIEQLLASDGEALTEDATLVETSGSGDILVVIGAGTTLKATKDLAATLGLELGAARVQAFDGSTKLLDVLWSEQRPSLLLVIGHLETRRIQGQPAGERIALLGGEWLTIRGLQNRLTGGLPWDRPRPIVVLAACESGNSDITRLLSFPGAFATAGAAGFVGTETVVFEGLAVRFALALTRGLAGGRPLGRVLLGFRRELMLELNPLGLVFTAYGDAELAALPTATVTADAL
jgi:hypothetical protein